VLIRADRRAEEIEAFLRRPDGAVALVDTGYSQVRIEVAAESDRSARAGAAMLRRALETAPAHG
jgi:hypothetical protein